MNAARKLILIAASAPLFAAPAISFAGEAEAMTACVNAFVSANLPKEQKVRVRTVDSVRGPMDIHARSYKINLTAKGAESGKEFAAGTCVVKTDGTLVMLNGKAVTSTELAALTGRR
jgi:hypothetical protein